MNYPERIIVIAIMAGVVAAGFTWFGWELIENLLALPRRRKETPRETAPNPPPQEKHEPEES